MAQEKSFESKVKKWLKDNGAWYVKYFGCAYTQAGVPDLLCCFRGLFLGVEVKADNGKPSDLQIWTIKQIRKAGGRAVILYPSGFDRFKDWASKGMVEEVPIEIF